MLNGRSTFVGITSTGSGNEETLHNASFAFEANGGTAVPNRVLSRGLPHPSMPWRGPRSGYYIAKAVGDRLCALVALPFVLGMCLVLVVLNPLFNPGPLFFTQRRMGQNRDGFTIWKFRTMLPSRTNARDAAGTLEVDRITPLGRILRKVRIDEWPNFFNVLLGDMSLVGPRPDAYSHAQHYLRDLPHYGGRLRAKPGITGLAQVIQGYAEGVDETSSKAAIDRFYVENCGLRLDAYILFKTVRVILTGFGGR